FSHEVGLQRWHKHWLIIGGLVSVAVPLFGIFRLTFAIEAGFLALTYAVGGWLILRARRRWPAITGRPLLLFACCLLTLNFLQYVFLCVYGGLSPPPLFFFPKLQ